MKNRARLCNKITSLILIPPSAHNHNSLRLWPQSLTKKKRVLPIRDRFIGSLTAAAINRSPLFLFYTKIAATFTAFTSHTRPSTTFFHFSKLNLGGRQLNVSMMNSTATKWTGLYCHGNIWLKSTKIEFGKMTKKNQTHLSGKLSPFSKNFRWFVRSN